MNVYCAILMLFGEACAERERWLYEQCETLNRSPS